MFYDSVLEFSNFEASKKRILYTWLFLRGCGSFSHKYVLLQELNIFTSFVLHIFCSRKWTIIIGTLIPVANCIRFVWKMFSKYPQRFFQHSVPITVWIRQNLYNKLTSAQNAFVATCRDTSFYTLIHEFSPSIHFRKNNI